MTQVRPGRPDDAAALLDIRRTVSPWSVHTVAGVQHQWRSAAARPAGAQFAIDDDEGLAALATTSARTWTSEEGAMGIFVIVAERARGRGYGLALLEAAEAHLREHRGRRVLGWVKSEPAMLDWVRRQGYELSAEVRFSRTTLDALPPIPPMPPGITTVSVAELGPEATYQVDSASMVDEPSDMPMDQVDYNEWFREVWSNPDERHDLGVVVLVDGVPAAATFIAGDPDSGRIHSSGTGTLREFRGRGLAKIAKSVALRRAREAGFTEAYTANDEVNAPMLAINTWLGYTPVGAEWSCLKTL